MPAYNEAATVERMVDAVLGTLQEKEVIVDQGAHSRPPGHASHDLTGTVCRAIVHQETPQR